jgi:hypothetical protein
MRVRCPSTYRYKTRGFNRIYGLQCKYDAGHHGSHCGYTGLAEGDVFWTDSISFLGEISFPVREEEWLIPDRIYTYTEPGDPRERAVVMLDVS